MKKELFQNLATIKHQILEFQERERKLQGEIIFAMKEEKTEHGIGVDRVRIKDMGLFSLVVRATWSYSDEIKLKVKKIYEKAKTDGNAQQNESESLRFTPKKSEK